MRTIKRSSLPQTINYNKKVYVCDFTLSSSVILTPALKSTIPTDCIKVEVLSSRLKNALDLYNKPYKPSIFYFKPKNC